MGVSARICFPHFYIHIYAGGVPTHEAQTQTNAKRVQAAWARTNEAAAATQWAVVVKVDGVLRGTVCGGAAERLWGCAATAGAGAHFGAE